MHITLADDGHVRAHPGRAIDSVWRAAAVVAAAAAAAAATRRVALMAVRIPAVVAVQPGPGAQSLVAVLLAVAEREQLAPPTGAAELVAVVVAAVAVGRWPWRRSGAGL